MKLCMVFENGYTGLVRFFWMFLKYMAVYILWILVWAWEWVRERVYVLGERESEEIEWVNELKICLGESEQTELHGVSV